MLISQMVQHKSHLQNGQIMNLYQENIRIKKIIYLSSISLPYDNQNLNRKKFKRLRSHWKYPCVRKELTLNAKDCDWNFEYNKNVLKTVDNQYLFNELNK